MIQARNLIPFTQVTTICKVGLPARHLLVVSGTGVISILIAVGLNQTHISTIALVIIEFSLKEICMVSGR